MEVFSSENKNKKSIYLNSFIFWLTSFGNEFSIFNLYLNLDTSVFK